MCEEDREEYKRGYVVVRCDRGVESRVKGYMQSRKWRVAADDSACGCGIPFTIHLSRVELGATSGLNA